MKNLIIILSILFYGTFSALSSDIYGIYINSEYFNKLESTKSFKKSEALIGSNLVCIFYKNLEKDSFFIANFYEGIYGNISFESNQFNKEMRLCIPDCIHYYDSIAIKEIKNKYIFTVKMNMDEYTIDTMLKLNDTICKNHSIDSILEYLSDEINANILQGNYLDMNNNHYVFTRDRKAVWPDNKFCYNFRFVEYDNAEYDGVINTESKPQKSYYYKWINDELYFYNSGSLSDKSFMFKLRPQ